MKLENPFEKAEALTAQTGCLHEVTNSNLLANHCWATVISALTSITKIIR
jgi:hypothetical protein